MKKRNELLEKFRAPLGFKKDLNGEERPLTFDEWFE